MRVLIYVYIFAALILSIGSLFLESYPTRFWIELIAPNPGDKYPISIVGLLSFLSLLLPLLLLMFILKLIRNRKNPATSSSSLLDTDHFNKSGIHFMRQKQMQNRLIASAIFINGEQKGKIDSGKTAFIALDPGTYEVEIGAKQDKSDKLIVQVEPNKHTQLEIRIIPNGLRPKHVIELA
nr:hypothetical protein [uncultured Fluviicola sp.]